MHGRSSEEVRFCLEICLTKLTGAVGQTENSHYSARARFYHYPDVFINSVEQREQQSPNTNTFLFNVNHRCRFTLTEQKLLSISPFVVVIDIIDENNTCIGTASIPLRTAPNSATAMSKTHGRGSLLRSISLFDAYGKYAGVLEADCVVYPEPKDQQQQVINGSEVIRPATTQSLRRADPNSSSFAPISGATAAGEANSPMINAVEGQAVSLTSNVNPSHKPLVLRVVVDETKFGDRDNGEKAVGTLEQHQISSATVGVSGSTAARSESLLFFFQYDIVFQLKSITDALLASIVADGTRLATIQLEGSVKRNSCVEELLKAVESVVWLSNVCLQIALGAVGAAPANNSNSVARESSQQQYQNLICVTSADKRAPNPLHGVVSSKQGSALYLLRFQVLYQVQSQTFNLSLLISAHRAALDAISMGYVHQQHREFFTRLATSITQLNHFVNIFIQMSVDTDFGRSKERSIADRGRDRERKERGGASRARRGERSRSREERYMRRRSPSRRRSRSDTPDRRERGKREYSNERTNEKRREKRSDRDRGGYSKSDSRSKRRSSSTSSSSSSSEHYSSDFSHPSSEGKVRGAPLPPQEASSFVATRQIATPITIFGDSTQKQPNAHENARLPPLNIAATTSGFGGEMHVQNQSPTLIQNGHSSSSAPPSQSLAAAASVGTASATTAGLNTSMPPPSTGATHAPAINPFSAIQPLQPTSANLFSNLLNADTSQTALLHNQSIGAHGANAGITSTSVLLAAGDFSMAQNPMSNPPPLKAAKASETFRNNSMFNSEFRAFGSFPSGEPPGMSAPGGGSIPPPPPVENALAVPVKHIDGADSRAISSIAPNTCDTGSSVANRSVAPSMSAVAAMHGIY